jgi:alkanesulfonate monooxygenase SsuD/methylene tetrahydromethanopterin reductase-like flavin-dependent oxidoreductase (luciferase family)
MAEQGTPTQAEVADLRFGIFDWIDQNRSSSLADIYEDRLRLLEYADEAGFWCYHLAEHHGTPLGLAPSPNLFLAAAAQRTERLRLGPLVQLLPLYNPLRNIEEVCILDNLSRGRLELGVGRGISAPELAIYDIDPQESRQRFREGLDILVMGLSTGRVSYEGQYYNLDDVELPVRPFQKPYPPLWYPTSNPESLSWIAEEGFNTLLGFTMTTLEETAASTRQLKALQAASVGRSGRLNGHVDKPLYGASRHVYVDSDESRAVETARAAYGDFDQNFRTRPGGAQPTSRRGDFDTGLARGLIFAGSPETVRAGVQEFIDVTGANYFVATFAFGSLTGEQTLNSMRLFAEEVIPAIRPAKVAVS